MYAYLGNFDVYEVKLEATQGVRPSTELQSGGALILAQAAASSPMAASGVIKVLC